MHFFIHSFTGHGARYLPVLTRGLLYLQVLFSWFFLIFHDFSWFFMIFPAFFWHCSLYRLWKRTGWMCPVTLTITWPPKFSSPARRLYAQRKRLRKLEPTSQPLPSTHLLKIFSAPKQFNMCQNPSCISTCIWERHDASLLPNVLPLKELTSLKRIAFHKLLSMALLIEDCQCTYEVAFVQQLMKLPQQLRLEFLDLYKFHYSTISDLCLNYNF